MTLAPRFWLFTYAIVLSTSVWAVESQERAELALIVRQFDSIQQSADRAQMTVGASDSARYRFDYLRFTHDLQRVRQGIHAYLSPSRAQPADLIELPADYRHDTTSVGNAHEHD
ncbi:integrative conjugative element protein, RAQPRD family [Pseudomonas sp. TE3610]